MSKYIERLCGQTRWWVCLAVFVTCWFAFVPWTGGQEERVSGESTESWTYRRIMILQPAKLGHGAMSEQARQAKETLQLSNFYNTQLNAIASEGWELLTVNEKVEGLATYWRKRGDSGSVR
jgi:hypothetical protein